MRRYQKIGLLFFLVFITLNSFSQTNSANIIGGSASFINISDTNSIYHNSKYVDIQEMFYPNPQSVDEDTNDPTASGMILQYTNGNQVYSKIIQIAPGSYLEIIYYPKKDE